MRPKFAIVVSRGFPATNRKEKLPSFSYTLASSRSLSLCDPNTHQNLHRLVTVTDGDVGGNLFVTADTEGTHGVTGLGEDRLLAGELLQHLKVEKKNAKRRRRQSLRSFAVARAPPKPPRPGRVSHEQTSSKTRALETRTFDALVRRSPLSPTQMLRTSL
jgi:hypothetical protein